MGFSMGLYAVKKGLSKEECLAVKLKNHELYKRWAIDMKAGKVCAEPKYEDMTASDYEHSAIAYGWEMSDRGDNDTFDGDLRELGVMDIQIRDAEEFSYGTDVLLSKDGVLEFLNRHKHLFAKFKKRDVKCHLDKDGEELDEREYQERFDQEFDFFEAKEYRFLLAVEQLLKDFPDSTLFEYSAG